MKLLVCGGRNYCDIAQIYTALDYLHHIHGISLLIAGGASGADTIGALWARQNNIPTRIFPADGSTGRGAGMPRNRRMLAEGTPDLVVAFPGGRGTAQMVRIAKEAGIPVRLVPTASDNQRKDPFDD